MESGADACALPSEAPNMTTSTPQHPDEDGVVEDHHQTEHKLDVIRRYLAVTQHHHPSEEHPKHRDCWIVDTHAGAGCTGAGTIRIYR
jgi:hypothetical protein